MNVRVEYDIDAVDLDAAIIAAEETLMRLAPKLPLDSWHVSMHVVPGASTGDGTVVVWRFEVSAHRGVEHGP